MIIMLKFYYTTNVAPDEVQSKLSNSLGGYKSSTEVPNDDFSNLFDEISLNSIKENRPQYIAVILKNEGDNAIENIELWFEGLDSNYGKILIGAIVPLKDEEGNSYIQRIPNMFSKPMNVQFYAPTKEEKVTIGSLESGAEVGLWFKREIDQAKAKEEYNNVFEKDPATRNRYKPIAKVKEEVIELHISYD